jgi:di/tricarboxylate transporter
VIPFFSNLSPIWVVAAFLFISMLLTQFISGPVAPIIVIPLALKAAQLTGIDPHPLAMAVALGCSLAFIIPVSHPVNVMVMNPGGYQFKDFVRVGFPLTILAFLVILFTISKVWGL